jgi:sec-independent protein translocase protein TatB
MGGVTPSGDPPVLFDLSIGKLLVLAIIAVVIFGPNQLPRLASQAGRALRELRRLADGAQADLREGLGPEFSDFDLADLHPRNFVRKHLLDGFDASADEPESLATVTGTVPSLAPGESPPYDPEAT